MGRAGQPYTPAGGARHWHEGFLEWLKVGDAAEEILALENRKFLSDNDSVAVVGFTRCLARSTNKVYEADFVHLLTFEGIKS